MKKANHQVKKDKLDNISLPQLLEYAKRLLGNSKGKIKNSKNG